ncbi:integral membrane sensor signal transduction histidine kinase [Methanocaldococcus sp. FS406-22]|uniref:cache domain-containing protein n=1 Tax=Methanocaldococcus sp. (strain FS406-22) TaxID=644281 RepID=UPI0001BF09CD|nr:cache domain-containing protein [Methanocaldococcus sp. FS406-22]ADC68937.1 integral membrane sensor signal transduction histidine kinase [Methanocaldococcus sp. FS406-22]
MVKKLKLRGKLLILSIIISIIPVAILGAVSVENTIQTMDEEAQKKINTDLQIAEYILNQRLNFLSKSLELVSDNIALSIKSKNLSDLKTIALNLKNTTNSDFVIIFDKDGKVLASSNNNKTGYIDLKHIIKKVLSGGEINSIEIIDETTLKNENLFNKTVIPITITEHSIEVNKTIETRALGLVSAKPILDENGNVIGGILVCDVLNKDYKLVDEISKHSGDVVTIFLDGIRVSTNVKNENGTRAVGTLVSKEVYNKVVRQGEIYQGRAFVVDKWYLTSYKPIYNSDGEIIGMLFVGTPEQPFIELQQNIKSHTILIGFLSILLALIVSFVLSETIISPIKKLKSAAEKISSGDYNIYVNVNSNDEIGELAKAFNKMAEDVRKSHEALKKHAKELEESYEKLKEVDRLKSEIISIVSHELRTPLTSIKGYVELVLDGLMGELNENQRRCLEIAKNNIDRLKRLIDNMLDLSKIESGAIKFDIKDIKVKDMINEVLNSLQPLTKEKNIEVKCDIEDNLTAKVDKDRIIQVLINLIENAIKFSPVKGVIEIHAFRDKNYAHIIIKDYGPGIPKKDLERIFDKFYQVNFPKIKRDGAGLGLAICKSIIEAHGGKIWVESELGKGSAFHILLPME